MDLSRVLGGVVVFDAHINAPELAQLSKVAQGLALVGCRHFSEQDAVIARKLGVQLYPMRLLIEDLSSACDGLMELAREWPSVQLHINSAVLDPAFAKAAKPVHGGLATRELFYFIERLKLLRDYAGGSVDCDDAALKQAIERALQKQ